jgi:hypothetical protein
MRAADCLGAFDASFGAGLLEGMARLAADPAQPVLVIAYDAPYPAPLDGVRPIADAFAVGLVLTAASAGGRGALLELEFSREPAHVMDEPALDTLRRSIPAARSLPLLQILARQSAGCAVIEYLDGLALKVEVTP